MLMLDTQIIKYMHTHHSSESQNKIQLTAVKIPFTHCNIWSKIITRDLPKVIEIPGHYFLVEHTNANSLPSVICSSLSRHYDW